LFIEILVGGDHPHLSTRTGGYYME